MGRLQDTRREVVVCVITLFSRTARGVFSDTGIVSALTFLLWIQRNCKEIHMSLKLKKQICTRLGQMKDEFILISLCVKQ